MPYSPEVVRLYYWYNGTPENRPGGPWWYRDFENIHSLNEFLIEYLPRLKAHAVTDNLVEHHSMDIKPPKDCKITTNV